MVIRVAHLSTAHGRRELRVHLKECNSLAEAGYEVHYVVADGLGRETVDKVEIHDLGAAGGRLKRILLQPWRMLLVARRLNAHIYHFHDPEILPIALFLDRGRARVVYDSHEDAPRALLSRDWLPAWLRPRLSAGFELLENFVARRLSGVIGATPKIANRFAPLNPATVNINNFPLRAEIGERVESINSAPAFCYQGGISRVRGICQMVAAFERVDAKLLLAGSFDNAETEKAARETEGWSRVDYRGAVSRAEVRWLMAKSGLRSWVSLQ